VFKFTDTDLHVFASTLRDLVQPSSASSLRVVTHNKHRFLWKLPRAFASRLAELYPTFLDASETHSRVRIEHWIDFPHAVLQHRNVVAFIHHGGANSFVEAGWCGVPQVILPQWADCYDTAAQAERLGLGVSNKGDADVPYLSVPVFTELLFTLLATEGAPVSGPHPKSLYEHEKGAASQESTKGYEWYKKNAERFAAECRLAGGAARAAKIIEGVYAKELAEWDGPAPDEKCEDGQAAHREATLAS
jgi:Erythromycin biosynthesis protein CIII-like, C-terminal domain